MFFCFRKYVFVFILFFPIYSYAEKYVLFFKDSQNIAHPVPDYDSILPRLKEGDVLVFSNRKKFEIGSGSFLNAGWNTYLVPLSDGSLLRIPIEATSFCLEAMDQMRLGEAVLQSMHIPLVRIYEAYEFEYIRVERMPEDRIILRDFFLEFSKYSDTLKERVKMALFDFAEKAALLKRIGDFSEEQLAFIPGDGNRKEDQIILFDWDNRHVFYQENSFKKENIFNYFLIHKYDEAVDEWWVDFLNAVQEKTERQRAFTQERFQIQRINAALKKMTDPVKCKLIATMH